MNPISCDDLFQTVSFFLQFTLAEPVARERYPLVDDFHASMLFDLKLKPVAGFGFSVLRVL
ncbi:MAG: hypothetical protein COA78_29000 [Blastopirellula sp.]|nr:MAG: hypothetical protein COA78_29000 [Blastopirellula sp.]